MLRTLLATLSETCTETADQVNIGWSTLEDPLAHFNATAVNETAESLEAARPFAPTYAISLSELQALTSTSTGSSPTSSSSPSSPSVSATPSTTATAAAVASPAPTDNPSSGRSGDAIGGIGGGVVGGLALLGISGIFLRRRRRNARSNPYVPAESHSAPGHDVSAYPPQRVSPVRDRFKSTHYYEAPTIERYAHNTISPLAEVPADRAPVELSTERHYEK
jgi:LPXTG-motif cell wall-anchored protein